MEITQTVEVERRAQWRAWLASHHATQREVWLVAQLREAGTGISYLDAVEEALCFGWIDGLAKRFDATRRAQRFTPRRPNSNWTQLNRERVARLRAAGLMTPSGEAAMPKARPFTIAADIRAALEATAGAWEFLQACEPVYQRVRVGYVEEQRGAAAPFAARLSNLVKQCAARKQFGNWNDARLRRTGPVAP